MGYILPTLTLISFLQRTINELYQHIVTHPIEKKCLTNLYKANFPLKYFSVKYLCYLSNYTGIPHYLNSHTQREVIGDHSPSETLLSKQGGNECVTPCFLRLEQRHPARTPLANPQLVFSQVDPEAFTTWDVQGTRLGSRGRRPGQKASCLYYCETLSFCLPVSHLNCLPKIRKWMLSLLVSRRCIPSLCWEQTLNPKQLRVRITQ